MHSDLYVKKKKKKFFDKERYFDARAGLPLSSTVLVTRFRALGEFSNFIGCGDWKLQAVANIDKNPSKSITNLVNSLKSRIYVESITFL
jgi:hypothetical protein